jgi:hypothetical protein
LGKKINITQDAAAQTTATTESGSSLSGGITGQIGTGARVNLTQVTTDAGIIAAASQAGEALINAQGKQLEKIQQLGIMGLESTKITADRLLSAAASSAQGEPTDAAAAQTNKRLTLYVVAAIAIIFLVLRPRKNA